MPDQSFPDKIQTYDVDMRPNTIAPDGVDGIRWYSPKDPPIHVAGLAWFAEEGVYRRLPLGAAGKVPEAVDYLANHCAGGQIRFQTDSPKLTVRVKLKDKAAMPHMPATGQCGIDCYIGPPGEMRYCNTAKFDHFQPAYECTLFEDYDSAMRNIVLNLPLYQHVEQLEIGVTEHAALIAPPAYVSEKQIIVYGTSITQGGCATRPGMAYTNILSRRIPLEFINLGFSGNGKGDREVAEIIATIEAPACLVLDYEANCVSTEMYKETLPRFIEVYRRVHPAVPVLVVSRIRYAQEHFNPSVRQPRLERKLFQQQLVQRLRDQGDHHIYFFDGSDLLGTDDDHECTVDGVHPTDLGFKRMADGLEQTIRTLVNV